MALSKHIPKYKKFNFQHAELLAKYSQECKARGSSESLKSKLFRKVDVWTAIFSDRVAYEHYDVIITGSDILLSLIAAQKLVERGKTVFIDYKPVLDDDMTHQEIQGLRNEMFNYEISLIIAHYSGVNPTGDFDEMLGFLSGVDLYGYSSSTVLPVLNSDYTFNFNSKIDGSSSKIFGFQNIGNSHSYKEHSKILKSNLPSLKLLSSQQDCADAGIDCLPRYLVSGDKLLIVSENSFLEAIVDDDLVVRIGSAKRSTQDYKKFTIADRLDDFEDAYDILSKI